MSRFRILLVLVCAAALAACSSAHSGALPNTLRNVNDSLEAMPGDSLEAMPGDSLEAMPGAQLACMNILQSGQVNCSVAISLKFPAIADVTTPSNLIPGLHPADLQAAYALPSQNSGGTVAIVDAYDDPAAETDLAIYRTAFGLPPCTSLNGCFRKVNQRGSGLIYPAASLPWSEEISLDLDVVSAVCPHCRILLVEANSASLDDLGAAVDTAANLGANAISNSYYGVEWSGETAEDTHYDHPGIAITASAGDEPAAFYPAASPYVTAVGGTSLTGSGSAWSESAWARGGRGCSAYESKPSWQGSTGCSSRASVDVAADADPQTGVAMFDTTAGGWVVAGGTSVGAPLVAAAYALSGNAQSPAFSYANPGDFHDVPPAGYDPATGLGSPDGVGGL